MKNAKEYNRDKVYDIMNTTQSNYSNMLKRLHWKKVFSNLVITYYSIALIIYTLTAEFFPEYFSAKMSAYFNIILSIVVLTYSLVISNAKYSERVQAAEKVLNEVKAKKRELTDENVSDKRSEYEKIMGTAEYRSEIDFFRTLKQKCKENDIRWYAYKADIKSKCKVEGENYEEMTKLNNYLSENFPLTQQVKILFMYLWDGIIILTPIILFVICFYFK